MNSTARLLTLALSSSFVLLACSDDATTGGGGGSGAGAGEPAEVIYEAEATDEALEALLQAPTVEDDAEAAYLTSPADGASIAIAEPPTFEWRVGPPETGSLVVPPNERFGLLPASSGAARELSSVLSTSLLGVFAPAQNAHAHGTPVNGRGYLLVIEDAAGTQVHRVFTLDLEHTPTQAAWEGLAEKEGPLKASVSNAIFESNTVVEQGGPFEGPTLSFTIE